LVGMNFKHIGLHLAKVEVNSRNVEQLLKRFKGCPYFLNGFTVSGSHNLCLFFIGEDLATMTALVDNHVRRTPEVNEVRFEVVSNSINDFIIPVELSFQQGDSPPCGNECNCPQCAFYETDRCNGCPTTKYYRGTFWR
ncbi:MAG: Lrp/AsnC family transcriptional regulator, partial [Candidatus Heimdallarchaeota archaeon]